MVLFCEELRDYWWPPGVRPWSFFHVIWQGQTSLIHSPGSFYQDVKLTMIWRQECYLQKACCHFLRLVVSFAISLTIFFSLNTCGRICRGFFKFGLHSCAVSPWSLRKIDNWGVAITRGFASLVSPLLIIWIVKFGILQSDRSDDRRGEA